LDYLALVNRAILEAGKDQDPLTTSNFANPPDARMYGRFKNWVNESYQQIQMDRGEWEFKSARASVFIYPAIYVEQGSRATAPPVGTLLQGRDTGYILEVEQVILHSGTWLAGTAKATIYYSIPDLNTEADFKFNEVFDEIDTDLTVLDAAVFRSKGWGRYDFMADGQLTDLLRPLEETFMIGSTGGSSIQDNDAAIGLDALRIVDWDLWQPTINGWAGGRGKPALITRAPDGDYEVYPRPHEAYVLNFTYNTTDGTLSAYGDTPSALPTRFHPLIYWMAVEKSGWYDRDRNIITKAQKEASFYRQRLETAAMPPLNFEPSRYNYE
jgi:hypothetical protein